MKRREVNIKPLAPLRLLAEAIGALKRVWCRGSGKVLAAAVGLLGLRLVRIVQGRQNGLDVVA